MVICLGTTPTLQRTMIFQRLEIDAVNRAQRVVEYASGKSTNVARVLHTLGQNVLATGFLGGERGRSFLEDLQQTDIPHDFVSVGPPTRLCTTIIDNASSTATELIEEPQPLVPEDYESLLGRLARLLERAGLLVLSGTLPPGAGPDFYARCVSLAGPRVPVIVDAVGEPLLEALTARPFIIKPNQSEVGRTLGVDVHSEAALCQAMRQLAGLGAGWVIVTRGQASTLLTDGQTFWRIDTPHVDVISAIGSGDSFAAGLAAGLSQGREVPQACLLAVACGAANAMTPYSGHLHLEQVHALAAQIRLERV